MADALPTDSNSGFGYNSPLATVAKGTGGTGGAFILGESRAAGEYLSGVKEQLKDLARQKAAMAKEMADASDVELKGAWDVDIPELQMEKSKIRDRATQILMKASGNKSYANSKQYYEDINDLNHMKDDLMMYTQSSAMQRAHHKAEGAALTSANERKYYKGKSVDNLQNYMFGGGKKGGIDAIKYRMAIGENSLLEKQPQLDYLKTVKDQAAVVGKNVIQQIIGDKTHKYSGQLTDASGQLTDTGKKANEAVDNLLKRPEGQQAVESYMYDSDGDRNKVSQAEAEGLVRKDILNAIPQDDEWHKHWEKETEGEKNQRQMVGDLQENVEEKFVSDGGKSLTTKADASIPATIKGSKPIRNEAATTLSAATGTVDPDIPASFQFVPAAVSVHTIKKGSGEVVKEKVIIGQATYFDKQDYQKAYNDLLKSNELAVRTEKGYDKDSYLKDDEKKAVAEEAKKRTDEGIDEYLSTTSKSVKTKQVSIPYEANKSIVYGDNAAKIDTKFTEWEKGKKTINRSDIPAKAKAAGYTPAEYEKLLKQKGITING